MLFTRNDKKIKGAAHKNGDVDGTCIQTITSARNDCYELIYFRGGHHFVICVSGLSTYGMSQIQGLSRTEIQSLKILYSNLYRKNSVFRVFILVNSI